MLIEEKLSEVKSGIMEIWESRSILKSLIYKDLFGRYKNSVLGFAWHFVMPIVILTVYYIVFTSLRSSALPNFWVYLATGVFPFLFMVFNLSGGAGSIVNNAGIIKKIYFPREIFVIAHVISEFIIMLLGYIAVLIIIAISGFPLNTSTVIYLPLVLVLSAIFVAGFTFLFSALTVYVRDVQYILNSMIFVFYFITPMYFPTDSVSGIFKTIIWINPFTYYIDTYHTILYYGCNPDLNILIMCVLLSICTFAIGTFVFHRLKHGFVERL